MTIKSISLGTLVAAGFLLLSSPAFAGDGSDREQLARQGVSEDTYSGYEETVMPPQAPTTSYDEPVKIERDRSGGD